MSSFVPHPLPHHSVTGEQVQNNKQSLSDAPRPVENSGLEQEVIMIDDISSNEGVTMENSNIVAMENNNNEVVTMENEGVAMEHSVTTDVNSQAIVNLDGSHGSTRIDLDQDDDIAIALEKFVDQSSDEST